MVKLCVRDAIITFLFCFFFFSALATNGFISEQTKKNILIELLALILGDRLKWVSQTLAQHA